MSSAENHCIHFRPKPGLTKHWFCFVWFDSLRPINNLSVIKGWVFLGWTSTKLGLMFLLKDTTQWRRWGSNPRPFGLESSTLPLSHCAPWHNIGPRSGSKIVWHCDSIPAFFVVVENVNFEKKTAENKKSWKNTQPCKDIVLKICRKSSLGTPRNELFWTNMSCLFYSHIKYLKVIYISSLKKNNRDKADKEDSEKRKGFQYKKNANPLTYWRQYTYNFDFPPRITVKCIRNIT